MSISNKDHNKAKKDLLKRRTLLKGLAGIPMLAGFGQNILGQSFSQTFNKEVKGPIPRGKLGGLEITRLIMGCNLISGYAHARDLIYANALFKAYHNETKVIETFQLAERSGINTTFITNPNFPLFQKYRDTGGKLQTINQTYLRQEDFFGDIDKAIGNGADALYIQGGEGDRYVRDGKITMLASAIEYIKKKGYLAGVGAHSLEVIRACEKEKIPTDFYVKTFHNDNYWSAHPESQRIEFSVDSRRSTDHNQINDNMFDLFHEKTAELMSGLNKPWIAFKVLAGGAIHPKDGFRFAFEKGADFVCAGMFDFQIADDVNIAVDTLSGLTGRQRPWFS